MLKILPALLSLFALPALAGGVYKCTMEGHTIFIDHPCVSDAPSDMDMGFPPMEGGGGDATGGEALSLDDQGGARLASVSVKEEDVFARQAEIARLRSDTVRVAVQAHTVLVGMDKAQVESALGGPCVIRDDRSIYWREGESVTVRFTARRKVSEVSYQRSGKPQCTAKS